MNAEAVPPPSPARRRWRRLLRWRRWRFWRFQFSLATLISLVIFVNLGFGIHLTWKSFYRPGPVNVWSLPESLSRCIVAAPSPDGRRIILCGGFRENTLTLWLWEPGTGKDPVKLTSYPHKPASKTGSTALSSVLFALRVSVCISDDGRLAFLRRHREAGELWDLDKRRKLRIINLPDEPNRFFPIFRISADGVCVLIKYHGAAPDGTSVVDWVIVNTETGEETARIKMSGKCYYFALSPDWKQMLTGEEDGSVRLWDVESGSESRLLGKHKYGVNSVAISSDGRRAFSRDYKTFRLWDLRSGVETGRLAEPAMHSIRFTPDGRRAITWNYSWPKFGLHLWDIERRRIVRRFRGPGGRGDGFRVVGLPDGEHALGIITRDRMDARACLWDLYPNPWPFRAAVALTAAFAAFLIAMKIRARRRRAA